MPQAIAPPHVPVGDIRTFGAVGEEYEVGQPMRQFDDGDWLVAIKLIKTGEGAEYCLTQICDNPKAL